MGYRKLRRTSPAGALARVADSPRSRLMLRSTAAGSSVTRPASHVANPASTSWRPHYASSAAHYMHAHLAEVAGFADAALPDDAVFAQFLAIAEWPVPLYEMLKTSAAKSAGPTHRAMPGLSSVALQRLLGIPGPRQGPPRRARHSAAPSSAKPNAIHRAAQRHRDRHRPRRLSEGCTRYTRGRVLYSPAPHLEPLQLPLLDQLTQVRARIRANGAGISRCAP